MVSFQSKLTPCRIEGTRNRDLNARTQEVSFPVILKVRSTAWRVAFTLTIFFGRLCWYVGEKYLRDLRAKEDFTPRVLESVEALSEFLVSEVRAMERSPESVKRDTRDQVPGDKVKDAPAVARELRWRVRLAEGYTSDGDHSDRAREPTPKDAGRKRKRDSAEPPPTDPATSSDSIFRNFQPKTWESVDEEHEESTRHLTVRNIGPLVESLSEWKDEPPDATEGHGVEVERKKQVVLKTRKIDHGFERQRVERVLERWSWDDAVTPGEADVAQTPKDISPTGDSQSGE